MIKATAKLDMIRVQPMPWYREIFFGADLNPMVLEKIRIIFITEPVQKLNATDLTALKMHIGNNNNKNKIQSNLSQKISKFWSLLIFCNFV